MDRKTDVIIIGGGQAGLATSRCLTDLGIEHLVIERGEVAQRWRAERWNSLRLLTPNWMTRLPGWSYQGRDPHGFMSRKEVTDFLTAYGADFAAPVMTHTRVLSVTHRAGTFLVATTRGNWRARSVVIATGACDVPRVPRCASAIDPSIAQVTLDSYKTSSQIARGGVLVVGASASGLQIASALQSSGRDVTLAAGRHTRVPRTYRGRDIMVWLERTGILQEKRDPARDVDTLARTHSVQLIGSPTGRSLDLAAFRAQGGRVTGRLTGAEGTRIGLGETLRQDIRSAEARMGKILRRIDQHIARHGLNAPAPGRIDPVDCPVAPAQIDLAREGIRTIIWATGYSRDYSWLHVPVLSPGGEIYQQGGATPVAGLYTVGLPYMRRCNSSFIDGVGRDARAITKLIANQLGASLPKAA